jgi:N-6 DNA methylase
MKAKPPVPDALLKQLSELWDIADKLRGKEEPLLAGVIKYAQKSGQHFPPDLLNSLAHLFGEWFTPHPVLLFSKELLAKRKPRSILDPSASSGLFLAEVAEYIGVPGLGFIQNNSAYEIAQALGTDADLTWKLGDPLILLDEIESHFDAVISNLPLGSQRQILPLSDTRSTVEVYDEIGRLILLKSALRLANNGLGLFIVSDSFFGQIGRNDVRSVLPKFGLRISACLSIPAIDFSTKTSVGGNLVLIEHGLQGRLFVGELSGDKNRNGLLLDNLIAGKDGAELAVGKLVPLERFINYRILEEESRISKMAAQFGAPRYKLAKIISEINLLQGKDSFPERANAVFLPLLGTSLTVVDINEGTIKPHNYVQLVFREEICDARYVAGFLNTPLGRALRSSWRQGATIPKISKASLQKAELYLPSREVQLRTIESATTLNNANAHIRELEHGLWSRPQEVERIRTAIRLLERKENLPEWLDHLPFPLASILWTYHASRLDPKARYEHLLHFFEALAEFMAIVFLSAFTSRHEIYEQERKGLAQALEDAKSSFEVGTFGTWNTVLGYLSKRARSMWNGPPDDQAICTSLFSCSQAETLEMLFSKSMLSALQDANASRNRWTGHGGIVSEAEAKNRSASLEANLAAVRDIFRAGWDSFELVQPRNCRVKGGIFENEVFLLVGPRTPFRAVERKTTIPLETGGLYLLAEYESRALHLLPLVRIMPAPKTELNACYFYSRLKGGKVRFVSYHFEQEAELADEFKDTLAAIKLITGTPDSTV